MINKEKKLFFILTLPALVLIVLHLLYPSLQIDWLVFALFILCISPWLIPYVKEITLPGGTKITLLEVKEASEKIIPGKVALEGAVTGKESSHTNREIIIKDPKLAIVGLRIEIEKCIRSIARKYNIEAGPGQILRNLISELEEKGILNSSEVIGLKDLIDIGNKAAHGAEVEEEVAKWAFKEGNKILFILGTKMA